MSRPKGSLNMQINAGAPDSIEYTTEQRVDFIATLIVERMQRYLETGELPPDMEEDSHVFAEQFPAT
jgi:hypothetical protein